MPSSMVEGSTRSPFNSSIQRASLSTAPYGQLKPSRTYLFQLHTMVNSTLQRQFPTKSSIQTVQLLLLYQVSIPQMLVFKIDVPGPMGISFQNVYLPKGLFSKCLLYLIILFQVYFSNPNFKSLSFRWEYKTQSLYVFI